MNSEPYLISSDSNSSPSKPEGSNTASSRIRRRNRLITSCLECRRRKLKCDKLHPCSNCNKFGRRECVFLAPALDSASQLKLTELKEKVGSLEHQLEKDASRESEGGASGTGNNYYDGASIHIPHDERDLEPTPMAMQDAMYDDDADDELMDLGIQLGRMRITERIGGFFRPKMSEELDATLKDSRNDRRSPEEKSTMPKPPGYDKPYVPPLEYTAPSSGFFFGVTSGQSSLIDFLPSKDAADRLVEQYYKACHPICRILHKQSFDMSYAFFWEQVAINIEPTGSLQAIVFAVLFSAVTSMDEHEILHDFGVGKSGLADNFRLGTETALAQANFLRSTKVETLQAFVLYLIPQCRDAISRAHSALTGTAIRIAECMGLHRDPDLYGMTPVEVHVRRLIWHQLGFLDLRTCEAHGPRPQIRKDTFDTKLPLNVNDADLLDSITPVTSKSTWTDMTFTIIRFECTNMRRTLWFDRPRVEKKQISLTSVLAKIEDFRSTMQKKYSFLDERDPIQRYAAIYLKVVFSGMHVGILHRYHNSVSTAIPPRLRQIIISSGTTQTEASIQLETIPEFHLWAWYTGAFQQWHTAFLLLIEIWIYPRRKEADRIWACLDYVFHCSPELSREVKARKVLADMRDKAAVFQARRKMKMPTSLANRLGTVAPRVASEFEEGSTKSPSPPTSQADTGFSALPELSNQYNSGIIGNLQQTATRYSGVANGEILANSSTGLNPARSDRSGSLSIDESSLPCPRSGLSPPTTFSDTAASGSTRRDESMPEINWDEWDTLFPPTENDGVLNMPEIPNMDQYPTTFDQQYPYSLDQLGQM